MTAQNPSAAQPSREAAGSEQPLLRQAPEPKTPRWTRREMLHLAATAAAGAGVVGGALALQDRRSFAAEKVAGVRDHRVQLAAGAAQLAIARGPRAAENARKAVEALGGMAAFIRPNDKVLIKPNVGWNRLPEQAADTNPEVVAQLVRMAKAAGASKVWVSDNPCNDADRSFERSGIRKAVGEAGGTLLVPGSDSYREAALGGTLLRSADLLVPFLEADKVINVPIAKQHGGSTATMAMKNWIGVIGGRRARLHQDLHRAILELAQMAKPTLTVLDATRVLLANGPSGGSLDDVKRLDTVAAGTDEVALDAFAASLLGFPLESIAYIGMGEKAGLGRSDYKSLKLVEIAG